MRTAWLALVLAGCAAAAPAAEHAPPCGRVSPARLGAIHFLSPMVGIGLTAGRCVTIAVTRDGGRTWQRQGTPLPDDAGLEQVAATSLRRIWAVIRSGPLLATTNGGKTWTVQVREHMLALSQRGRTLWAIGCLGGSGPGCVSVLVRHTPSDPAWTIASPKIAPSPVVQLAPAGRQTVLVNIGRFGVSGGTLLVSHRGRSLERPDPRWLDRPCDPAELAASGKSWWLMCLGGAAAGSSEKALLHTSDGGRTWHVVSELTNLIAPPRPGAITRAEPSALAAGSARRLWLASPNSMTESEDGGVRWSEVPGVNAQGFPEAFDVLSPRQAWLLAAGQGLWRTTDGRHWHEL